MAVFNSVGTSKSSDKSSPLSSRSYFKQIPEVSITPRYLKMVVLDFTMLLEIWLLERPLAFIMMNTRTITDPFDLLATFMWLVHQKVGEKNHHQNCPVWIGMRCSLWTGMECSLCLGIYSYIDGLGLRKG